MTPAVDTMTEDEYRRLMGWKESRRQQGAYRVIGRDPVHQVDDRLMQFQACKSLPAAMKSAAMAQGKRFKMQGVRIVIVL